MLIPDAFTTTFLDRESVPQASLNIENRTRTNLLPWAGQFSPQLIEELLTAHGDNAETVADPFSGSGTSLIEAARLGKAALGSDVNPGAVILSRVYELVTLPQEERDAVLSSVGGHLHRRIPLLQDSAPQREDNQAILESILLQLWNELNQGSERVLMEALVVLSDFYSPGLREDRIHKHWNRLVEIVQALPHSDQLVSVRQSDARALPVETDSVDLVLTSPPYINVHNYHQKFRRSVEALGWDVLTVASSEIGSNRQNRGNRFLTVIQYSLDMVLALREMTRVTRPGGRLIIVVGRESQVRKVPFFNGRLVAELAAIGVGLGAERRQERQFVNRYGESIYEDILHFQVPAEFHDEGHCLTAARSIADQTLAMTRQLSGPEAYQGIADALERIDLVSPSPLFSTEGRILEGI